jgi:hypothetical protein
MTTYRCQGYAPQKIMGMLNFYEDFRATPLKNRAMQQNIALTYIKTIMIKPILLDIRCQGYAPKKQKNTTEFVAPTSPENNINNNAPQETTSRGVALTSS